jgi:hypothetical protein
MRTSLEVQPNLQSAGELGGGGGVFCAKLWLLDINTIKQQSDVRKNESFGLAF